MDELEKRLADLEKEIESLERKKNNHVMEHLLHEYDTAMDRTTEYTPSDFINRRYLDF